MADDRFPKSKAAASATTPILIDKLPPEVQEALKRQAKYNYAKSFHPDQRPVVGSDITVPIGDKKLALDAPDATAAADTALLRKHGITGRTVLSWSPAWTAGDERVAYGDGNVIPTDNSPGVERVVYGVDRDGRVTSMAARQTRVDESGFPTSDGSVNTTYGGKDLHKGMMRVGGINAARSAGRLKAQPAAGQLASALDGALSKTNMRAGTLIDVGQALYPFLTDEIDTDFTIKLIPPQHRKPDETGKVREAIAILDGEPIRLYEGEPWNVPGFESVGVELADYFRSRSPQSRGQDVLGAEVDPADKSKAGLEVRESEKQAQSKQAFAKTRAMIPGPSVSAERDMVFPTFEEEYKVGKASKEPGKK